MWAAGPSVKTKTFWVELKYFSVKFGKTKQGSFEFRFSEQKKKSDLCHCCRHSFGGHKSVHLIQRPDSFSPMTITQHKKIAEQQQIFTTPLE